MTSLHRPRRIFSDTESRQERHARRRAISQTHWAREHTINQPADFSDVAPADRMRLLQQYGDFSLAYSTAVQPLLKHYGDASGYIAYRQRLGVTIALGDPVVADQHRAAFLAGFIAKFRRPVFCQVSRCTAEVLNANHYRVNELGVDTSLPLAEYSLAGKEKEWLRYAANWVQRRGYRIVEADFNSIDVDRIEAISEAWRKTRTVKTKEVRFLNRPIVLEPEASVRRFFLQDAAGTMQAFVFFDPLFRHGKICGYVTSFKRRHPDAPPAAEQAIMKVAIERMKAEGVGEIRLGLSPFAGIEDRQFDRSWFTANLFRWLFSSKMINRWAYHLSGHAEYKRRFRGVEEQTYFACRTQFSGRPLAALIGLCGIA